MQLPITIGLHRSRFLALAFGTLVVVAVVALLAWPGGAAWRGGLLLGLAGLLAPAWRRLTPEVAALRLLADGGLEVRLRGAAGFVGAELLPGAGVHPWLSVARLRLDDGRRLSLLATGDSMDPEDFRRWRVFLRWRAKFSGSGAA